MPLLSRHYTPVVYPSTSSSSISATLVAKGVAVPATLQPETTTTCIHVVSDPRKALAIFGTPILHRAVRDDFLSGEHEQGWSLVFATLLRKAQSMFEAMRRDAGMRPAGLLSPTFALAQRLVCHPEAPASEFIYDYQNEWWRVKGKADFAITSLPSAIAETFRITRGIMLMAAGLFKHVDRLAVFEAETKPRSIAERVAVLAFLRQCRVMHTTRLARFPEVARIAGAALGGRLMRPMVTARRHGELRCYVGDPVDVFLNPRRAVAMLVCLYVHRSGVQWRLNDVLREDVYAA